MSPQDRSNRRCASTWWTHRLSATPVGSAPTGTPNASASECAASVERTSVRAPRRAASVAVPAAEVVLPTPPLPVNRMIRGALMPASPQGLDALLQPFQRGVDDDLLGLPAKHPDHRDGQVDGEPVGHVRPRGGG